MTKRKKTFKVILPDGKIETRRSFNDYPFVIVAYFDGSQKAINRSWDGWGSLSWHTRRDLADSAVKHYLTENWKKTGLTEVRVMESIAPDIQQESSHG